MNVDSLQGDFPWFKEADSRFDMQRFFFQDCNRLFELQFDFDAMPRPTMADDLSQKRADRSPSKESRRPSKDTTSKAQIFRKCMEKDSSVNVTILLMVQKSC